MWSITLNILILIKKLLYILNNGYGEIICAKYDGSRMNNVCTVCPANDVGLPAKVIRPTKFFLKKKVILYGFCVGHWPADMRVSSTSRMNIHLYIYTSM